MLHKLRVFHDDIISKMYSFLEHRQEINKYKDSRRAAICFKAQLTDEQKKQIDDFYITNYGKKIPYTWHQYYTACSGKFDVQYFPELLYRPKFEKYMNLNISYHKAFKDKNILPYLAQTAKIDTPKILFSCIYGAFRNSDNEFITRQEFEKEFNNIGEVFIKPSINTSQGKGCAVVNMKNGTDKISGKQSKEIIDDLGKNFAVQEKIVCHESLSKIYPYSVNSFRIITYRWKNEIYHMPVTVRFGQGGNKIDNAHAGGISVGVNDDGTLHKKSFTEFNDRLTEHPDTHIVFEGYKIPYFDKLIAAAKKMHMLIPQMGNYNWDFTLNEKGSPVLIEVNIVNGSIWPAQMAHGKGVFGDKTAEVLQWLKFMNKLPEHERKNFLFGRQ